MGKNLYDKIIGGHLVSGEPAAGNEIGIRIDQTLTQDALGTMAYLQFESMGVPLAKTDSVSYVDHNTLQDGFENADDHRYLQTVADKHGIKFSKAGNGICHQVHLERFSGEWCSAKDIILELLRILTTKGNVGIALEYSGPGVAALSVPERSTIANMGTELGVTTSIFPSDGTTRLFFRAQEREGDWTALAADPDAAYDRTIDLDLGSIVPMVARPHSPDNVTTVGEIAGMAVNQVLIGSCTNSSYRDLMVVAGMLKGRKVHADVSFGITTGSKQVLSMIARNGALNDLIAAGARILESTCGFCVGCGQAPQTNAVSVRTNNRNFEGRSGTRDARVYLVSPETAAATALTGKMTDPRDLGMPFPEYRAPDRYAIDDALVILPGGAPDVEVFRGPNIGPPPANSPMPESLTCKVAIKVGDKITTDHIMPAGSLLKYRSNIPKYAQFVFKDVDSGFAEKCRANAEAGFPSAIIAGQSYGQGSSREHAAMCPMYLGVRLLLAKSVERIHAANLVNFGILMLAFEDAADYDRLKEGDELAVEHVDEALRGERLVVRNRSSGYSFNALCGLTDRQKAIVLAGGALNFAAVKTGR